MDISFILSSLSLSGGVRVVIQYANRLTIRGYRVSLIVPRGTVDAQIQQEIDPNIRIIEAGIGFNYKNNIFKLIWLSWEMAKAIPRGDLIIATHTPTTAVSFIASKILSKGKVIWYYMDYQEMFEKRPVEKWLLRNALRWHDYAITLSEACVQELHSFCSGEVINVGLGIDTENVYHHIADEKNLYAKTPEKKAILFLGDERPRKGMTDFVVGMEKVYASRSDLILWVASKEVVNIQTKVPIKLFTRPSDKDLAALYSACDVFVSASWYEGLGLPPLEAMACGAAVITTDSRGIREFAVDGYNCLVVPPKNPEALAGAVLSLLANPDLVDELKKNGPITAERFNWDQATDRFEAALKLGS